MNIIALDCGASFLKGAKFDGTDGRMLKQMQKASPTVHRDEPLDDTIQIDALCDIVRDMIFELIDDEKEISIGFSTEMHGFLLANEDGRAYTDYISWQKEYGKLAVDGQSAYDILNSDELSEDIRKTGMPLRSGLPSCNLLYLNRLGFLKDTYVFYTLGDYLIRRIFNIESDCHPTNAAASGFMDVSEGKWNNRLVNVAGYGKIRFPKIGDAPQKTVFNGITFTIYPAVGDQQAALFGAGLNDFKTISFNLGTGAQVSVLIDKPQLFEGIQTRPFFNDHFIKTLPHLPSGRAINVYIRFLENVLNSFGVDKDQQDIWNVALGAASKSDKHSLNCDMSFFENPITTNTVGSLSNIGEYDLELGNLFSSIFGQMVANFLWASKQVQPDEQYIDKVVFSGGIARRIDYIREGILKHFTGIDYSVAENETLVGVYKYIKGDE